MKIIFYDLELDHIPKDWTFNFDKKARYESGMAFFMTSKRSRLEMIWDTLEKYTKKHASVDNFMKSYFEEMRAKKQLKQLTIDEGVPQKTETHEIQHYEFKYTIKQFIGKPYVRKVIGLTFFCRQSNRIIFIYAGFDPEKEDVEETAFRDAINSFNCTCTKQS